MEQDDLRLELEDALSNLDEKEDEVRTLQDAIAALTAKCAWYDERFQNAYEKDRAASAEAQRSNKRVFNRGRRGSRFAPGRGGG